MVSFAELENASSLPYNSNRVRNWAHFGVLAMKVRELIHLLEQSNKELDVKVLIFGERPVYSIVGVFPDPNGDAIFVGVK